MSDRRRVLGWGAASALLFLVAALAGWQAVDRGTSRSPAAGQASAPGSAASGPPSGPVSPAPRLEVQQDEAAVPVRVRVPAVGISSRLDPLALLDDGTLEAPPRWQVAGWYAAGPRPGETGPAVIAGHVDSPTGPAVFTALEDLAVGDRVLVDGRDGSVQRFEVTRLTTAPRDRFPTEAVYGSTPDAELRLITCDGRYDAASGGYENNLVVFATALTDDTRGG